MVSRRKLRERLSFDFGFASIAPHVGNLAAKAVAINANNTQDALLLLDMLGLVQPQEGNTIKIRSEVKAEQDLERERLKTLRRKVREANKAKEKLEQLKALGIEPHEIGE